MRDTSEGATVYGLFGGLIIEAAWKKSRIACRMPFSNRILCSILAITVFSDSCLTAQDSAPETDLSASDVMRVISDEAWVLVDTRATDAYNGWALDGIERGGHIPDAVDFPASWIDIDHKDKSKKLAEALRTKGITRDKHIVLYSTTAHDRHRVGTYLRESGFRQLHYFNLKDWTADSTRPLIRYENFHLLVPASVVKRLLDGQQPETFENATRIRFAEVSWGDENASYSKGHVPRSFHVNTDHFEPPPEWKLGDPGLLNRFSMQYGFHVNDTVIVSSEDPTASYRLAIVLRYAGVRYVRVLNGGFTVWKVAGFPIETRSNAPGKIMSFGADIPVRPTLIDDISRVRARLQMPDKFMLIDTRTWAEFIGKTSGYKYHVFKGRIPGSVYGQTNFRGENSLTPYRNIDNTMRNAREIMSFWKEAGIGTDKHLSFMCGGGWRAAEVLTFAQVIGISNASLYSDGWIGWSNDRENPVEQGVP